MTEASQTLNPQTSTDTHNVTFSQGLAVGLTHYDWLDGKTIDPVGRDLALVSHSASPGRVRDSQTLDTCGPLFAGSSLSADPQRSLENRLRVRMEGFGSPEYVLTWKHWDIGLEPPICALRASGHHISGKDYGGWPTPRTVTGGAESAERKQELGRVDSGGGDLQAVAQMAGWKTPHASDGEGGVMEIREGTAGHYKLRDTAHLVGWPTPQTNEPSGPDRPSRAATGRTTEYLGRTVEKQLVGWPMASSRDWKDTPGMSETGVNPDGSIRKRLDQLPRVAVLTGSMQSGGPAGMESIEEFLPEEWEIPENGKLNPRFSLWLMGYPIEWASCGERVTR